MLTIANLVARVWGAVPFYLWRLSSRLIHGQTRWIRVYGDERLCVRSNDFRAFRIARLGGSQREKVEALRTCLELRPRVYLDVGANYGEFVLAARGLDVPVIAIEPNPALTGCLTRTFAGEKRIIIRSEAISDTDGTTEFFADPKESGSASRSAAVPLAAKRPGARRRRIQRLVVPCRRLDSLVPELLGSFPDSFILKVDVEGGEEAVLAGAERLISSARWWRALVEYIPAAIREVGGDPVRLWATLAGYPGIIIRAGEPTAPFTLAGHLPADPPAYECDVLIGVGAPDAPAAGAV